MYDYREYHSATPGSIRWKLVSNGIDVEGEGIKGTGGKPSTIKKIWDNFGSHIISASQKYQIPVEIIFAIIAGESFGKSNAYREEPGFISDEKTPNRVSAGLTQTLLSTARMVLNNNHLISKDLFDPGISIDAGGAYIKTQIGKTKLDPVLVAAAYNSGGVYFQNGTANRFKLRVFPIGESRYIDKFILWFNDARAAIKTGYISLPGEALTAEKSYTMDL